MSDQIQAGAAAIAAVTPTATFKEIHAYDRSGVEQLPGVSMGWMGARKADELGIRPVLHRRKWLHTYTVRLWFRYDPVNATLNDQDVRTAVAIFVDAIEADPTLGARVDGAGVTAVAEPAVLVNAQRQPVGRGVDVTVEVVMQGPWQ